MMGSGIPWSWWWRRASVVVLLLLLSGFKTQVSANILQITGVLNGKAELPCDKSVAADDQVNLILWYKNETKSPIYSLDFRTSRSNQDMASHNPSDAMASRAFLKVLQKHAVLQLKPVEESDEGLYRCRVDFRKSPTRNELVNLTVVVPPREAFIVDDAGQVVTSPWIVNEDSKLILSCEVLGGRPTPRVKWWRGTKLLPDVSEESSPGKIRSDLIINRITRKDVNVNFTCQASNTNLTVPLSKTISLDVNLRPLDIKITSKREPMFAGNRVNLTCRSNGSRPYATITWLKNNKRIPNTKDYVKERPTRDGNGTVSVLHFIPTVEDNGKFIMCRAENPRMPTGVLEDSWKMDVFFPPTATLELGSSLKKDKLKEGDDVYFECTITANPRIYAVEWKFEDRLLQDNKSVGIIISNQSLVLQKVKRTSAGSYTCIAKNVAGVGESNPVVLTIKHAPVCRPNQQLTYGVARREVAKITCEVSAIPHQVSFKWMFNNSVEMVDIPRVNITSGGLRSTVGYSPYTEHDYGVLYCWGRNDIGEQREPCKFLIIAAGPPDVLQNCTIQNQTEDALHVECNEGFDGGMEQRFIMEVYDAVSHQLKKNITNSTPVFQVKELEPGTGFTISVYAVNAKGKSESRALTASTLRVAERRTDSRAIFAVTPILGVLIGVVAALVLVAIIIVIVMRLRAPDIEKKHEPDSESIEKSHASLKKELEEFDSSDEKNPDVVPNEDDCFLRFDVCDNIIDINDAVYADVDDKMDHKLNNINSRIYENVHNSGTNDSENMYENVNNIRNQHGKPKLNKQPEDITYAELQLPNNQRNNTIRRVTEPTVYAQIDHTRKVALPNQETEDDEPPTAETPLMNSHRESTVQDYGTGQLLDGAQSSSSSSSTRF